MGQADYYHWSWMECPRIDEYSCIITEPLTHRKGIKLSSDALLSDNLAFEGILDTVDIE